MCSLTLPSHYVAVAYRTGASKGPDYMYTHTYIHACIHAYMHTCMHAYMHTCIQSNIHTYIHTCKQICVHTFKIYTYIYTQPCIRTYISMYVCITHTYPCTCVSHIHIHVCVYTGGQSSQGVSVIRRRLRGHEYGWSGLLLPHSS